MHLAVVRSACIFAIVGLALLGQRRWCGWWSHWSGRRVVNRRRSTVRGCNLPAATTHWASIKLQNFPRGRWRGCCRSDPARESTRSPTRGSRHSSSPPRRGSVRRSAVRRVLSLRPKSWACRIACRPSARWKARSSTTCRPSPARLRAHGGSSFLLRIEHRFEALQERGFSLAAFLYAGPASGGFTKTVRVTDDSFPVVPLFMTLGVKVPVRATAFLIGSARARVGNGPEIEI